MNERIKELVTQARGHWNHGDFNMPKSVEFQEEDIEKFVELIVRECVLLLDSMADPEEDSDRYIWALHNASHHIRQHFGIKV